MCDYTRTNTGIRLILQSENKLIKQLLNKRKSNLAKTEVIG
jgi:hypothetical protein